ncbi:MAG: hypothetical protein WKG07_04970 [Hymenobacter sp.]
MTTASRALVVCAVPFLRDRDLRLAVAGETPDDRQARIRESIAGHYAGPGRSTSWCCSLREQDVPVLATGHLYAAGGEAREGAERDVHIGGLGLVGAEHFPAAFDYVALGHLHRPAGGGRAGAHPLLGRAGAALVHRGRRPAAGAAAGICRGRARPPSRRWPCRWRAACSASTAR